MTCHFPDVRSFRWRSGRFHVLAWNAIHSNNVAADWIDRLWENVNAVRDVHLGYARPFFIVFGYHIGTSRPPQTGRSAGLRLGPMIQIRVRHMCITLDIGKDPTEEAVRSTELDPRVGV